MTVKSSKTFTVKVEGASLTVADLKDLMKQLESAPDTARVNVTHQRPMGGDVYDRVPEKSSISVTWTES